MTPFDTDRPGRSGRSRHGGFGRPHPDLGGDGLRHRSPRGRRRGDPEGEQFGRPHGHRHGGRGRTQRGDVRAAILLLLAEEPKHGYQLMQDIAERTGGAWRPSPGAVYPTITMLEDEGYVAVSRDGSRQLVTLTEAGSAYLEANRERLGDPFAGRTRDGAFALRDLMEELALAVRQVARTGSDTQVEAARTTLAEARRAIYLTLADDPATGRPDADDPSGS